MGHRVRVIEIDGGERTQVLIDDPVPDRAGDETVPVRGSHYTITVSDMEYLSPEGRYDAQARHEDCRGKSQFP